MQNKTNYLVEPEWLNTHIDSNTVIIDCWQDAAYERAHISGAVCLPVDYWMKEDNANGVARGMYIMDTDRFEKLMGLLGVTRDTPIVTYDDGLGRAAARVWWVLRYHGHQNVKVLNGGWIGWFNKKYPISIEIPRIIPKRYEAVLRPELIIRADELLGNLKDIQIVDARSREEWIGMDPHGNPRAGRIPGAINLEWKRLILDGPECSFRTEEELKDIVASAGLDSKKPVVTYCQAGVRAAHVAFVLTLLGFKDVRVYDGSICEWSRRIDTPMAVGE